MATLVENAIRIKQTFDDMYDAIVAQGQTPTGGVDTYAASIDKIGEIKLKTVGNTSWYGGGIMTTSSGSGILYSPAEFYSNPTSDPASSLASDGKSITMLKSGVYIISIAVFNESTNSSYSVNLSLYQNGSAIFGGAMGQASYIKIDTGIKNLNAGDILTLKFQKNNSAQQFLAGALRLQRINDL